MKRAVFRVSCFVIVIRKYTPQEAYSEKGRNKHPPTLYHRSSKAHQNSSDWNERGFAFFALLLVRVPTSHSHHFYPIPTINSIFNFLLFAWLGSR